MTTLRRDLQLVTGDTLRLAGTVTGGLTGSRIVITVKRFADDADPGLAQISTDDGSITIDSDTEFHGVFSAAMTETWPPPYVRYDVQVTTANGEVYTTTEGFIQLVRGITAGRYWTP